MWEQSTRWESVEGWVIRYLKQNHPEYREMQTQAIKLVENHPALWKLMNESRGVALTQEDHKDLHNPRMLIEANAARVIEAITKTPLEIPEDAEIIDMCKAVEDMIKDSKAEGKMEGRAEGKAEGVLDTLIGLVKDDLLSVKEAAKHANMTESEFEEKIKKLS